MLLDVVERDGRNDADDEETPNRRVGERNVEGSVKGEGDHERRNLEEEIRIGQL